MMVHKCEDPPNALNSDNDAPFDLENLSSFLSLFLLSTTKIVLVWFELESLVTASRPEPAKTS
jgi:hypothetical protein